MSVPTPYSECSTAACARLTPVDAAVNVTTAATPTARPTATITIWRTRPRRPRSRYVTKNLPEDFASAESGPFASRAVMTRTQAAGAGSPTDPWVRTGYPAGAGLPTDPWVPAADRTAAADLRPACCCLANQYPSRYRVMPSRGGTRSRPTGTPEPLRRRPPAALPETTRPRRRSQGMSLRLPPVVRCPSRSRPHQLEDRALGRFYGEGGNTGST